MNEKNIYDLEIKNSIKDLLVKEKVKTIKQLCKKSKNDLRNLGLTNNEVNQIDIQLQLIGLSLKDSL